MDSVEELQLTPFIACNGKVLNPGSPHGQCETGPNTDNFLSNSKAAQRS